ncbi:MAG TPA: phosphonate ABC transporter, permease protein PhnE, partial [Alphaproteobacteria bacterium]|nr:phosphonate ABC transporter, permease protein PhnE [Alphaproteobacteria bacterium]
MIADQRKWERFTPQQRMMRFAFYLASVAALVVSMRSIEIIPEFLYDAPEQVVDLFARMWPMDFAFYPAMVHDALIETLHIATLGTILAMGLALPVGLMAARNVTPIPALNYLAKFILVSSRSVNSLVWALLFVAVFGPGALAG